MAEENLRLVADEIKSHVGEFYVYILLRPDGTPFYVGCGLARAGTKHRPRVFQHEEEARAGRRSRRHSVIRKIWKSGGEVGYRIDSWHSDECGVFAREIDLIDQFGRADEGKGPLANSNAGGTGQFRPGPDVRAAMSAAHKHSWTPERRARAADNALKTMVEKGAEALRAGHKAWLDTEHADKVFQSARERWDDPEYRARHKASMQEAVAKPEYRAKRSKIAKATFSDPAARKAASEKQKANWANPAYREAQAEKVRTRLIELRKDPEFERKRREGSARAQQRPESRAAAAERMRRIRAAQKAV